MIVYSIIDLLIGLAELTLAALIAHRAIPQAMSIGKAQAMKVWTFSMAIALFGLGRMTSFLYDQPSALVYTFGHLALIYCAFDYYRFIMRNGKDFTWWDNMHRA